GVKKQETTANVFKPTVRLFKRWAQQYRALNAPSFYVECAVHSVSSSYFDSYLPLSLASGAIELLKYTNATRIASVANDKDILVRSEWPWADFRAFQTRLQSDVRIVLAAMDARTESEGNLKWKQAFGD